MRGGAIAQEIARLREIPWTKEDTEKVRTDFYLGGKLHGLSTEETLDFYERAIAERITHKTDVQQQALRLAFHEALIVVTGKNALEKIAGRAVKDLQSPPSQELIINIRQRVRSFDSKPLPVRERIIQEARATRVGERISKRLEKFFASGEKVDQFFIKLFEGVPEKETYQRWIIQLLQIPRNRKFLGQLAIEWFSRRR